MLVKTPSGDHFLAYAVCDPEIRLKKKKNGRIPELSPGATKSVYRLCREL